MYDCHHLSGVTTDHGSSDHDRCYEGWASGPGIPPPVLHSSPRCPGPRPELERREAAAC